MKYLPTALRRDNVNVQQMWAAELQALKSSNFVASPNKSSTTVSENASVYTLERQQPLSKSLLWKMQRDFFETEGANAWQQGIVPNYITSNYFIAHAYAQVVIGFFRDYLATTKAPQPIHILELGAGVGKFSFLFLKIFQHLHQNSLVRDVPFLYIVTDLVQQNIDYCRNHPVMQSFIQQKIVDFACFDVEYSTKIKLQISQKTVSTRNVKAPIVAIANYLFDSIPQDSFYVENGKLFEDLVTLVSPIETPKSFSELEIQFEQVPCSKHYYDDPQLDAILQKYSGIFNKTHVLFPNIAVQVIRNLQKIANDRLLLLSGDKGYIHEESLQNRREPSLAIHGSFSLMVNYHAIQEYFSLIGGQTFCTKHSHQSLNIVAFLLGQDEFLETKSAYLKAIEEDGPDDFFCNKKEAETNYSDFNIEKFLRFSRYTGPDPSIFMDCLPTIAKDIQNIAPHTQKEFCELLMNICDHYYPVNNQRDFTFNAGILCIQMHAYNKAIKLFQRSMEYHGKSPNAIFNIGMCYYYMNDKQQALEYMERVLELDPRLENARGMKIQIECDIESSTTE